MSDSLIEHQCRQVIAELELLAHGKTATIDGSGGHSDEPMGCPPGERSPPHDYWRGVLGRALGDDHALTKVLEGATRELESWRPSPREATPGETTDQFEQRLVKEGEGWAVQDVANHMKTTPKIVRRVRREAGVDEVTGLPVVRLILPSPERAAKAKAMRAENLTYRQIAAKLGCGVETVRRDLAA